MNSGGRMPLTLHHSPLIKKKKDKQRKEGGYKLLHHKIKRKKQKKQNTNTHTHKRENQHEGRE